MGCVLLMRCPLGLVRIRLGLGLSGREFAPVSPGSVFRPPPESSRRLGGRVPAGHALLYLFFFFNDTATTEIYTLSLHDALPISGTPIRHSRGRNAGKTRPTSRRSEEHTSELQSRVDLVCRLLLEKKKKNTL